jgi:hypothetical protein
MYISVVYRCNGSGGLFGDKNLLCFKLRMNRKLYVKGHADKLNVGYTPLRFFEFFSASVNPPLPSSSVFGSFLAFVR